MTNITVSIPAMKLKVIDLYCQEKKIPRSVFLSNCALTLINATRGNVKCNFCARPALGKYKMTIYDMETGEREEEKFLCTYHLQKAKSEGAGVKDA